MIIRTPSVSSFASAAALVVMETRLHDAVDTDSNDRLVAVGDPRNGRDASRAWRSQSLGRRLDGRRPAALTVFSRRREPVFEMGLI